ncbi:MAG: protein-disulfide reductase DsbD N-terminal domain-containing protein, partial [Rhizobiales bacterium]|nr:protein-disulfide reductase DsbD N-terminal domain-containing protein [Hyphomicrobiales bacterium]
RLQDDRTVEIEYVVADGYYLYRKRFEFLINGRPARPVGLAAGKMKNDPLFGRVAIFRQRAHLKLAVPPGARGQDIEVVARSQGCADAGVCYPPLKQALLLAAGSRAPASPRGEAEPAGFTSRPERSLADQLKGK